MTRRIRIAQSDELEPERQARLTELCEAAFGEPFDEAWHAVGPGLHVMVEADGRIVAHAMIVDRGCYIGHEMDVALDTGYVEHVATLPEAAGRGHATAAMAEIGRIIREEYELGALSTGSNGFYERLGWETWIGPTAVRTADGELVRSAGEDGHVMILRTPRTPPATTLDSPIAVDWRAGEPW